MMPTRTIAVIIALVGVTIGAALCLVRLGKWYFDHTHSFKNVYVKARGRQRTLEDIERTRVAGDKAMNTGKYAEAQEFYLAALKLADDLGPNRSEERRVGKEGR